MDYFDFYCPTHVIFGRGARKELIKCLIENSWKRVGLVVDHNLFSNKSVIELIESISATSGHIVSGQCSVSEPTYEDLEKMRKQYAGQNLQVMVGIGGGSALDMAKAMAVLVTNPKPAISYLGFNKMENPVLPIVTLPTTAGTGSEVTPNASFIDSVGKRKMGINGECIRPRYSLLDPELTLSCPEKPTISSAVDSIVHAIEAYVAKKTNPMARMFAKEGLKNVFNNLSRVVKEPNNIISRERIMYGAFLSGIALMNSGTGPAAAMSYPLGVHFRVPHGIGGGIFIPLVIEHNIKNGYYDYADLYEAVSPENPESNITKKEKAELFLKKVSLLFSKLNIPDNLSKLGVTSEFVPIFLRDILTLRGALEQNPVPFLEKEILSVLNSLKLQG